MKHIKGHKDKIVEPTEAEVNPNKKNQHPKGCSPRNEMPRTDNTILFLGAALLVTLVVMGKF
jgi:hypothetical protein